MRAFDITHIKSCHLGHIPVFVPRMKYSAKGQGPAIQGDIRPVWQSQKPRKGAGETSDPTARVRQYDAHTPEKKIKKARTVATKARGKPSAPVSLPS